MGNFTAEKARALGGADWLTERRRAAAEQFASMPLPTPSEEAWRYSRIDEFELDRYAPATATDGSGTFLPATVDRAATVRVLNGAVVGIDLDDGYAAKGLVVADIATLPEAPAALGVCADGSPDAFTLLNDAFLVGGTLISIPDGMIVEQSQ